MITDKPFKEMQSAILDGVADIAGGELTDQEKVNILHLLRVSIDAATSIIQKRRKELTDLKTINWN